MPTRRPSHDYSLVVPLLICISIVAHASSLVSVYDLSRLCVESHRTLRLRCPCHPSDNLRIYGGCMSSAGCLVPGCVMTKCVSIGTSCLSRNQGSSTQSPKAFRFHIASLHVCECIHRLPINLFDSEVGFVLLLYSHRVLSTLSRDRILHIHQEDSLSLVPLTNTCSLHRVTQCCRSLPVVRRTRAQPHIYLYHYIPVEPASVQAFLVSMRTRFKPVYHRLRIMACNSFPCASVPMNSNATRCFQRRDPLHELRRRCITYQGSFLNLYLPSHLACLFC